MKRTAIIFIVLALIVSPTLSSADNISRDYIALPPGTLLCLLYYTHKSADTLYKDGDKVAKDIDFTGNVGLFRPVMFAKLGPFVWDPQCIIPYGDLNLESDSSGIDVSATGLGDPVVFATIWFVNKPESKTWLGFTPYFFIPIGDYSNHGILSMGENRWKFREEFGFVKGFEPLPGHSLYLELTLGADFFTDNDDYTKASVTLEQDPIFNLETHISYDLTKNVFAAIDYYYHNGGETTVDGVDQNDAQDNHAIGATLGFSVGSSYQFLFKYKKDVSVESGLDGQAFTFRFTYVTDVDQLFGKGKN